MHCFVARRYRVLQLRVVLWLAATAAVATPAAQAADAGVTLRLWSGTFFGGPGARTTVVPVPAAGAFSQYTSARFTGSIAVPTACRANFTVLTDGVARLWVDDHLLVDVRAPSATPNTSAAVEPFAFTSTAPVPFRLEYAHYEGDAPLLLLSWTLSTGTAPVPVPPTAFTTTVSPAEATRQAMRDRQYDGVGASAHPWGTYDWDSMASHVLLPAGFAVDATLGEQEGGAVLGNVWAFRQSAPAVVTPGPHSPNGSEYTSLRIGSWRNASCSVVIESAVLPSADADADATPTLGLLATSSGSDCSRFVLLVRPKFLWGYAGSATQGASAATFVATIPGSLTSPTVVVTALSGTPVTPFPAAGPAYIAMPLSVDGAAVGIATGVAPRDVATVAAAAAEGRQATLARRNRFGDGELAEVWDATDAVIQWNTVFTPVRGMSHTRCCCLRLC